MFVLQSNSLPECPSYVFKFLSGNSRFCYPTLNPAKFFHIWPARKLAQIADRRLRKFIRIKQIRMNLRSAISAALTLAKYGKILLTEYKVALRLIVLAKLGEVVEGAGKGGHHVDFHPPEDVLAFDKGQKQPGSFKNSIAVPKTYSNSCSY